ncbi:uncharacterized protein LOC120353495 [Nilaparvata lugens]|uniref:uncharacterized protein LOC120353495 n=1 Tax=Nilaparvata lugens TaxID=108931 RepID=UPI00193E82A0|nr:uncharacterized protein LOC120353495 [Nilaparvata lugens]
MYPGLPGLFAGFVAASVSYQASESEYGMFLYSIFPARAPLRDSPEFQSLVSKIDVDPGTNRTAFNQACFQIVAIPCTLAFSIIGGVITGTIINLSSPATDLCLRTLSLRTLCTGKFPMKVMSRQTKMCPKNRSRL